MPTIDEILKEAIAEYEKRNAALREQMRGRAYVPTWDGLPYDMKLVFIDNVVTVHEDDLRCHKKYSPIKIEYYIGGKNA